MGFYFKRLLAAWHQHRAWTLLALLPPILYLLAAGLADQGYTIRQAFSYSGEVPIAEAKPVGVIPLRAVLADPGLLFLDGFALKRLEERIGLLEGADRLPRDEALRRYVHLHLSIEETTTETATDTASAGFLMRYQGPDGALGRELLTFYSERLIQRVTEGQARQGGADTPGTGSLPVQTVGALEMHGQSRFWSGERTLPALAIFLLATLALLGLLTFFELSDTSLKSERQIARYLGLPVLGSMPDATPLTRHLKD